MASSDESGFRAGGLWIDGDAEDTAPGPGGFGEPPGGFGEPAPDRRAAETAFEAAWRRRRSRTLVAGVLAVLGLGLLVLGPAALAVAWYDPPDASPERHLDHRVGDPVPDGLVTFVVHEVRCGPAPEQTAHGQLCEITLGARNTGEDPVKVPSRAQSLHVSQGARHQPVEDGTGTFGTLEPREARTARLRFDLPMGVTITHLELRSGTYRHGVPVEVGTPYPLLGAD